MLEVSFERVLKTAPGGAVGRCGVCAVFWVVMLDDDWKRGRISKGGEGRGGCEGEKKTA